MILSFWGCSNDKDFGGLENIGWNEKPLQITTRILTTKSTNFIQEFKSTTECAKFLNIKMETLSSSIKGKYYMKTYSQILMNLTIFVTNTKK